MAFESLFSTYDRLVLFDTETTGLLFHRDEIIEFAAVVVERVNGIPTVIPKSFKIQELKSFRLNESTKNIIGFPVECQHVKVHAKVGI